jgi:hypothetical protein
MKAKTVSTIANRIIKKHGPIIDLRENPEALIDVLRELSSDIASGNPCGGTPPAPGPTKAGRLVTNEDLMKVVLQIARDLNAIRKSLGASAKRRAR